MLDVPAISGILGAALDEDYRDGDCTSRLCLPEGVQAKAEIVAREELVVCGLEIVDLLVNEAGFDIDVAYSLDDGELVSAGTVLVELYGLAYELLAIERTALNFLQRLAGVATHTAEFVASAGGLPILDTRKTIPGWRYLDKYATQVGGARNHRMHLADMILVKDTHIAAAGGIAAALESVFDRKPYYLPVEVEVATLAELQEALAFPIDVIMLDNMDTETIRKAITQIEASVRSPAIEVSGGITLERLQELQQFRNIAVSVGSLTTCARNRDIAMQIAIDEDE